ncbi:MAG: hypothetical protein E6H63_11160, partial [Betaproteobacteria bacterium]
RCAASPARGRRVARARSRRRARGVARRRRGGRAPRRAACSRAEAPLAVGAGGDRRRGACRLSLGLASRATLGARRAAEAPPRALARRAAALVRWFAFCAVQG